MFNKLPASRSNKSLAKNKKAIVFSAIFHILLVGIIVMVSKHAKPEAVKKVDEILNYLEIKEPVKEPPAKEEPPKPPVLKETPKPPSVPDEKPAVLEAPKPVRKGFQTITPPQNPPVGIPEPDPNARPVDLKDYTGVGQEGGVNTGVKGGESVDVSKTTTSSGIGEGEAYQFTVVDEKPELKNAREMERVLERLYPYRLKEARIEGTTMLEFIIDANGEVEPQSIVVLESDNEGFISAAKQAATRLRFKPAKAGGSSVRVIIHMPIKWTIR